MKLRTDNNFRPPREALPVHINVHCHVGCSTACRGIHGHRMESIVPTAPYEPRYSNRSHWNVNVVYMPKKEQLSKEGTKFTSSPDTATKMLLLTPVVLLRLSKNWTSLLPLDVTPENTSREIAVKRINDAQTPTEKPRRWRPTKSWMLNRILRIRINIDSDHARHVLLWILTSYI